MLYENKKKEESKVNHSNTALKLRSVSAKHTSKIFTRKLSKNPSANILKLENKAAKMSAAKAEDDK